VVGLICSEKIQIDFNPGNRTGVGILVYKSSGLADGRGISEGGKHLATDTGSIIGQPVISNAQSQMAGISRSDSVGQAA
jgi:hypothetical protein